MRRIIPATPTLPSLPAGFPARFVAESAMCEP